jgi:hypothetical protein
VQLTADLTQFYGHDITIYIRTWQDGSFTYEGMYVDNVTVNLPVGSTEGFETSMGSWATPASGNGWADVAPWTRGSGLVANDWQGTLAYMGKTFLGAWRAGGAYSYLPFTTIKTYPTTINPTTQSGSIKGPKPMGFKQTPQWLYVVSNRADHILRADYMMNVTK